MASKASGSEDEPLVPDDFDDDFFKDLLDKIPEATKSLRQGPNSTAQDNADNVQRLTICANRYKHSLELEKQHTTQLSEDLKKLTDQLDKAEKASKLDQDTIGELKKVIESAWKQKDAAQMREQGAQDEVLIVREKLEEAEHKITTLSEKKYGFQSKRDENKEIEILKLDIKDLNKRLQIQRTYTNEVETTAKTLEIKNKELLKMLEETSYDAYANRKKVDELEKEITSMKGEALKFTEQITQMQTNNAQLIKLKVRQNLQVLSLKTNLERLNTQHNAVSNKLAKTTVDLEYAVQEGDKNKNSLTQKINLLKVREEEIIKLKQDNGKAMKTNETLARKYVLMEEGKQDAEKEVSRLKTQLKTQDKELEAMRRVVHHFENNNENLTKERDGLKRDLLAEHSTIEETESLFHEAQHEVRSLKDTIHLMDLKYKKLKDDYLRLRKEKAKKLEEIQTWIDRLDALQNEIHLKENYELELKRTINDLEDKCNKLTSSQESLKTERNNIQRNLQVAEEDKTKLRGQISNLQIVIENLKGKVSYRDGELSKLQLQVDRMEKERRMLKNEIRNAKLGQQHTRVELLDKKKENDRFCKSLQEDEQKIARLKKDLDNIINEKNSIAANLTKKNEEYCQLKDALDNLQTAYDVTVKQFAQCHEDMRLMKVEIKNLRTERNVLKTDRENSADLRHELLQSHRLLNQERIKAKALQEELLTPMNVHRWRSLKGSDPEKLDLIEKIQNLRKQIINQNIACLEKDRALEESERLYLALKEFMLKLPSHKIREELNSVKATLSGKQRKLKAVIAELQVKNAEEKAHSAKLEEMKNDLTTAKYELNEEKKKKVKLLEERNLFVQMQAQCFSAPSSYPRTLGAGFKMIGTF